MRSLLVASLLIILLTPTAHADEGYRNELLISDGVSFGLVGLGVAGLYGQVPGSEAALVIGTLVYMGGAPVLHVDHEHGGRAAASVGLRLGAVVLSSTLLVMAISCGSTEDCGGSNGNGTLVGMAVITIAAAAIDDFLITPGGEDAEPRLISIGGVF